MSSSVWWVKSRKARAKLKIEKTGPVGTNPAGLFCCPKIGTEKGEKNMTKQAEARTIITQFSQHLQDDGKSPATIESYVGDVADFTAYLEGKGISFTDDMKRFHITSFKKHLVEDGFEVATINKKINSVQAFNYFLMDRDYMTEQVVDLKKDKASIAQGSEREVEVLKEPEVERLLFYLKDRERVDSRDSLIVTLLPYTGVSVGELVSIRRKDLDSY